MSKGSVTNWIQLLQAGDSAAVRPLWNRYFDQLVRFCRNRLAARSIGMVDGEDVALSVLDTVCRRARDRGYPNLKDRECLWRLLVVIAARKVVNARKHEMRAKRGGGRVVSANIVRQDSSDGLPLETLIGKETSAEFVVVLAEMLSRLDGVLPNGKLRLIAQLKLEGFGNREIAKQAGCSIPTIERKLRLIRDEFRGNFES